MTTSARWALKAATDDIHQELDDTLSRLDLGKEGDYRRLLRFHGRTVPPAEAALAQAGLGNLVDGWEKGRRTGAIQRDLAAMGESVPPATGFPILDGTPALLGAAYVLEGSRLGGRVLQSRVGAGLPTNFFGGSGTSDPWSALVAVIDRQLASGPSVIEAQEAARRCFSWFLEIACEAGIR